MRTHLTVILLLFAFISKAQDSSKTSGLHYFNHYEISAYGLSLLDQNPDIDPIWGGNELSVHLLSYTVGQHEIAISSGVFFIDRKPDQQTNPHMQYFYFPLNLSYRLYSKNRKFHGKIAIGRPLLSYEDSKYANHGDFWLNYEDAAASAWFYDNRKKILATHQIRFGYFFSKHLGVNIGEMSYIYSSTEKKYNFSTRIAIGLEFRL